MNFDKVLLNKKITVTFLRCFMTEIWYCLLKISSALNFGIAAMFSFFQKIFREHFKAPKHNALNIDHTDWS